EDDRDQHRAIRFMQVVELVLPGAGPFVGDEDTQYDLGQYQDRRDPVQRARCCSVARARLLHRLVAYRACPLASVPIPKFARFRGTLVCELWNRRTLATY